MAEAGILYAPDYVINAGGIINVGLEYLGQGDEAEVMARIAKIPSVWSRCGSARPRRAIRRRTGGRNRAKVDRALNPNETHAPPVDGRDGGGQGHERQAR